MAKRITDEQFLRMLINKQFEINGITDIDYDLVIANREVEDAAPPGERWYERYTTTKDKEEEFMKYLTEQVKKRYKIKGRVLEANVGMLMLNYGLKRSDFSFDELKKEGDE
jgi:hypothetical protein